MSDVRSVALERVGAGDEHGRHVEHVGGEPRGGQRADELRRRHEHLPAEMAALLLRRELILEVHAGGARLDHRPHQLVGVERAAEAGLGVGDDRREPVRPVVALRPVDLVGAQERVVQAPHDLRHRVRRVEALVGVRRAREVRVGGDLPAREVDRLQACLDHLHGLAAGERAERVHVAALRQEPPEPLGAEPAERAFRHDGAAQPHDVLGGVAAGDPRPALVLRPLGFQLCCLFLDPSFDVHGRSRGWLT